MPTPLDIQSRKDRAVWLADRAKRLQAALDHTTAIADDIDLLTRVGAESLDALRSSLQNTLRIVSAAAKALDQAELS